jgi:hypothetical protein
MEDWLIVIGLIFVLFFVYRKVSNADDETIRLLYRQAARYSVASMQDASEVIQVLHANYAMGYLLALKDLATGEDFERVTGEDLLVFERKIARIQDDATRRLVGDRPDLVPLEDETLLKAIYSS